MRDRRWSSRPRAGSSRVGSSPTSRSSTRRSTWSRAKPAHCVVLQRPQLEAGSCRVAISTGTTAIARCDACAVRAVRRHRSSLHPLHVGHDGAAEGDRARQRRPCGGAGLVDAERVRRRAGRGVLGGVGRRLGRRPLVHRLRAPAPRLHHRPLRGQARRHTRPRRVLACRRRSTASTTLFTAPTAFRAIRQEDPDGLAHPPVRPAQPAHAVSRRRAMRPRDAALGRADARRSR